MSVPDRCQGGFEKYRKLATVFEMGREDVEGISARYLDVVPKITYHALVTKVVISR